MFQCVGNGSLNLGDRFVETVGNLRIGHVHINWHGRHLVWTLHNHVGRWIVEFRHGRANHDFDLFGGSFPNLHIVLVTHVFHDVGCQIVAGDTDGFVGDNPAQGDDGNFGRSTTDIDHHVAFRCFDIESDANCGSHWFVNHINVASSGVFRRVTDRTDFNFGGSGRDANHHFQGRSKKTLLWIDHFDHSADHLFCCVKVGNYTIP